MTVLAIVQARMSSSRLPGKVLKPILHQSMISHQLDRLSKASLIDKIVVATSTGDEDTILANTVEAKGYDVFRGDLNDVLDRYDNAARCFPSRHIVRLTADCPLVDHQVVDQVIAHHIAGDYDYTNNVGANPTFPDGLDVEIMRSSILHEIAQYAQLGSEREHVTLYIKNHSSKYKIGLVCNSHDMSASRWVVDEAEDLLFVRSIYDALYSQFPDFVMGDIVALLQKQPELSLLNCRFQRDEGLKKSLREDIERAQKS